jgi:hypothetical protein
MKILPTRRERDLSTAFLPTLHRDAIRRREHPLIRHSALIPSIGPFLRQRVFEQQHVFLTRLHRAFPRRAHGPVPWRRKQNHNFDAAAPAQIPVQGADGTLASEARAAERGRVERPVEEGCVLGARCGWVGRRCGNREVGLRGAAPDAVVG